MRFTCPVVLRSSLLGLAVVLLSACGESEKAGEADSLVQKKSANIVQMGATTQSAVGKIKISWDISAPDNTITGYDLQYQSTSLQEGDTPPAWDSTCSQDSKNCIRVLQRSYTPDETFDLTQKRLWFRIRIVRGTTAEGWVRPMMAPHDPSSPQVVRAIHWKGSAENRVDLSWVAPRFDGGIAIARYDLESSTDGVQWASVPNANNIGRNERSLTFNIEATHYRIRAVSTTTSGVRESPWIEVAVEEMEPTIPDSPTNLVATAASNGLSVDLQWERPGYTGGSDLTTFEVEKAPDVNGGPGEWSSVSVSGIRGMSLTATVTLTRTDWGQKYYFRLFSKNSVGLSEHASDHAVVVVPNVPGVPINPILSATSEAIQIAWVAPEDNGSPITGYNIRHKEAVGTTWTSLTATSLESQKRITGLTNGTEYLIDIQAVNAVGAGSWYNNSALLETPKNVPDAPVLSATVGDVVPVANGKNDSRLELSWTTPTNQGSTITHYQLERAEDISGSPGSFFVIGDMLTGNTYTDTASATKTYHYKVKAFNSVGGGMHSSMLSITAPDVPSVPTGGMATATNQALQISWTAPNNGGSAITGYDMRYKLATSSTWATIDSNNVSTNTSYNITGLTNSSSYNVQVRAKNGIGDGMWSGSINGTPDNAPSAPRMVSATPSALTVVLSWSPPTNTGGANLNIVSYKIEHAPDNALNPGTPGVWTDLVAAHTSGTSYTHTGRTKATTYHYRISATNNASPAKTGAFVMVKTTTNDVPGVPTSVTKSGSSAINGRISWTAPTNGGEDITGYQVQSKCKTHSGARATCTIGNTTSFQVFSHNNCRGCYNPSYGEFCFRVRATNGVGYGGYSAWRC